MRVSLQRLEGFYWVAKSEGYAEAARNFPYPISQPGIYQQVKGLEQEIGVALFTRVAKDRLKLTPAGEALFAYCAPFLAQLPRALEQAAGLASVIAIDAGGLVMRQLLPAWTRRIWHQLPTTRIELRETTAESLASLEAGDTDIWVDFLPAPPRAPYASKVIGAAQAHIIAPKFHKKTVARPETLGQHPFIAYPVPSSYFAMQAKALATLGIVPPTMVHATNAGAIMSLVNAGVGASIIPVLGDSLAGTPWICASPMNDKRAKFPIYACYRKARAKELAPILALAPSP